MSGKSSNFAHVSENKKIAKKQRNHAFDLLCGICILRMIMLHVSIECGFYKAPWWQDVLSWSYYFMSFFFFKAGYFNKTVSGDTKAFIIGKAKSLMLPYLVWGFVGSAVYMFLAFILLRPGNWLAKGVTLEHLWTTSTWYGNSPTWFLMSFFTAYVAMHLISKAPSIAIPITHNRSFRLKLHWLVLTFPWISYWLFRNGNPLWLDLDNVTWGIFLFFLGRLWHVVLDRLTRRDAFLLSLLMVVVFVYLNYNYPGGYYMYSNKWTGNFYITLPKVLLALCGLSGMLISLRVPAIPLLDYVGRHSMVYFVGHYPIIYLYRYILSYNNITVRSHWYYSAILLAIIIIVLTLAVPWIERVPWMSGRFPKPHPASPKGR